MQTYSRYIAVFFLSVILAGNSFAQDRGDTIMVNRKLLKGIIFFESISSAATLGGLYVLWYADYPHSSFHFFNDNDEWLQMDKAGHATAAYNIGRAGYQLLRWPGVDKKKSVWYGGTLGFAYLTIVEIMDGFSAEWGASAGDLTANTLGSALFIGQQLAWDEQRISLKWSYHETKYARYRPDVLGSNFPGRMLKDYNGQSFWLSLNVRSFLPDKSGFPKWLNVALGYGAEGMLGGTANPSAVDGVVLPAFNRTRRYFLSFDLALNRIETSSKILKTLLDFVGVFKIPFPAVEYNSVDGWKLHGLYF